MSLRAIASAGLHRKRNLQAGQRKQRAQRYRRALHVAVHAEHALGDLQVDPSGVVADALARPRRPAWRDGRPAWDGSSGGRCRHPDCCAALTHRQEGAGTPALELLLAPETPAASPFWRASAAHRKDSCAASDVGGQKSQPAGQRIAFGGGQGAAKVQAALAVNRSPLDGQDGSACLEARRLKGRRRDRCQNASASRACSSGECPGNSSPTVLGRAFLALATAFRARSKARRWRSALLTEATTTAVVPRALGRSARAGASFESTPSGRSLRKPLAWGKPGPAFAQLRLGQQDDQGVQRIHLGLGLPRATGWVI